MPCTLATHCKKVEERKGRGVVIGCYETDDGVELTDTGKQLDKELSGGLMQLLNMSGIHVGLPTEG